MIFSWVILRGRIPCFPPPFFVLFVSQKLAVISGLDSKTRPGEGQFGNFICIIGFLVMENSAAVIHAFVIEFAI